MPERTTTFFKEGGRRFRCQLKQTVPAPHDLWFPAGPGLFRFGQAGQSEELCREIAMKT